MASWFEVRVPREQAVYALEALAASGSIELDDDPTAGPIEAKAELRELLNQFRRVEKRYQAELPTDEVSPPRLLLAPEDAARHSLACLRKWCADLLRLKRRISPLEREHHSLRLLGECLAAMHGQSEGLEGFGHSTRFLCKQIMACPKDVLGAPSAKQVLSEVFVGESHDFWLVAGIADHAALVDSAATLLACQTIEIPGWLTGDWRNQQRLVRERLSAVGEALRESRNALAAHRAEPAIRAALAGVRILEWYAGISLRETSDHAACQLAGWTGAEDPAQLERLLRSAGIDATVVFGEPGSFKKPPIAFHASRWAAPFRWALSLFGTPGQTEVDPTPVLALVVPLLFGFMFPDVGHGLILAVAGAVLSRRSPAGHVLLRCGLVATLFGFGFGEFFGVHGLLPAPLGRPLEQPFTVIVASLLLGAALLLLGLVFSGVEAVWQGELRRWLLDGAPVLALYAALWTAVIFPHALSVAGTAVAWYVVGAVLLCRSRGVRCVGSRLGHLLEATLQLVINTLSFLRVGAFALAHCALSLVVIELVLFVDNIVAQAIVFTLGQTIIIILEGLVVSVQTTRLVLFEFFIRFLRLEGRPYRPLQQPPAQHVG